MKDMSLEEYHLFFLNETRDEPDRRYVAVSAAIAVGCYAARKDMSKEELGKWIQCNYGRVHVKQFDLKPPLNMKEWRVFILKGFENVCHD